MYTQLERQFSRVFSSSLTNICEPSLIELEFAKLDIWTQ